MEILVNRVCMNFVIYFLLTCGLPIWLGFFSYKDVAAGFENFLVPQGSLMSCNIISKCGKDSFINNVSESFSYKDYLFILVT
jgi:hypothetical protein